MSVSKFRIPRLTAAVLLLGGACGDNNNNTNDHDSGTGDGDASGDGDGDGDTAKPAPTTAGSDITAARVTRAAQSYCKAYAECYADDFADQFDSQEDCISSAERYFNGYVMTYGKDCGDAALDVIECEAALDCSVTDDKACSVEDAASTMLCPEQTRKSRKKARGLRIPR